MSENKEITLKFKETTFWKVLTFIFLVLFIVALFWNPSSGDSVKEVPTANGNSGAVKGVGNVIGENSPVLGNPDAGISIIEFSDFQCPYCGRAFTGAIADMKKSNEFKNGEINFVYRNFPLNSIHPFAQKAAEASLCADNQGKFWEYHDRLFVNQNALDLNSLKAYASGVGLDVGTFSACLDSGEKEGRVKQDVDDGLANGARGTPYFIILNNKNGNIVPVSGAQPWTAFESAINSIK